MGLVAMMRPIFLTSGLSPTHFGTIFAYIRMYNQ